MAENSVSNSLPPTSPAQSKVTVGGSGITGSGGAGMHHYHHHHHHHHHNHHKSMDMGGTGKMGGSKHHTNVIHRTTSESLRLGGGGGGGGGGVGGGPGTGNGSSMNHSVSGSNSSTGTTGTTMGGGSSSTVGGNGNLGSNESSISSGMLNSSGSANSISRKSASSSAAGGGGGGPPNTAGKTSSFTITSVIVGPGKHSADNGDDSADDLDESHTDDNSRITDFENETPSFSEDTFSKEDVFFGTNAIGSVPVIPTSSQYGLAIVAPTDRTHGGEVLADAMHVSVTDGGINIMGHGKGDMSDGKELHHRNERFKVVKIESTEPFKRGRWVCMDYLDHTTLQQGKEISGVPGTAEGNEATVGVGGGGVPNASTAATQDSGVGLNDNSSYAPSDGPAVMSGEVEFHPNVVQNSSSALVMGSGAASTTTSTASNVNSVVLGLLNNESPGQSLNLPLAGGTGGATVNAGTTTSHVQSTNTSGQGGGGAGIPHSLPQSQLQNALAGGGQPTHPGTVAPPPPQYAQQGQSQYYPHTMNNLADLNLHQQQATNPLPHQHHVHGATLPSNIQMHPQPQQQPQPSSNAVSSSNILPPLVASIPTSQEMNIIINNPSIQSSFPSPHQQFKSQQQQQQQQQAHQQQVGSQTNSPVVVPTSLIENAIGVVPGADGGNSAILSPSGGTANIHDTAGSVSAIAPTAADPLMNSSPTATSSPVTSSSAQIIPQSGGAAAGASSASVIGESVIGSATGPTTSTGGSITSNGPTAGVVGIVAGSPSTSTAAASGSVSGDTLSSEAKLLSAVSGATAGTVAGDGSEDVAASATAAPGEDGER